MAPLTCEACERAPATVDEETDDPRSPMRVCAACHGRLTACALRPREWFNLARRHGPQVALLHDDMYDEDGVAQQPEVPVVDADAFPAPTLADAVSAEALLDVALTRHFIRDDVAARWRGLEPAEAVDVLEARWAGSTCREIRERVLELAALTGAPCAGFVRRAWQSWPVDVPWHALVEASAGCLPIDEGFPLAEAALAGLGERDRRGAFGALGCFRTARALRWIEAHYSEPFTDQWGYLAAKSAFDWPTAKAWLAGGRPLSLVAIDALVTIAFPRSLVQERLAMTLAASPGEHELRASLEAAMAADPVPRVRQRIEGLLGQLAALA